MNPKAKKILWKIFKVIWIAFGVFLLFMLFLTIVHAKSFSGNGFAAIGEGIAVGVALALALFAVAAYIVINGIFFLVRWLVRRHRRKKND